MIQSFYSPEYYEQRAAFLLDVAKKKINHVSEVRVSFSPPDSGWIDMSIYIDGVKVCAITWSDTYDPAEDIKNWLTDIISEDQTLTQFFIDQESSKAILTFEEFGVEMGGYLSTHGIKASRGLQMIAGRNQKEVEDFNNRVQLGLFTVYEPWDNTMPVKAIVNTRQLVGAIYFGLLSYVATYRSEDMYKTFAYNWRSDFIDEDDPDFDYIMELEDENPEYQKWVHWMFYNSFKSPKLEWYLFEESPWKGNMPDFSIKAPRINDYVFMTADWDNGLFWQGRDHCCGNVDKLKIGDAEIDLSDIKGLKEWYDEYKAAGNGASWSGKKLREWQREGRGYAFEIRRRLPSNIDLFFNCLKFKYDPEGLPNVMSLIPNVPIHTFYPLIWRY